MGNPESAADEAARSYRSARAAAEREYRANGSSAAFNRLVDAERDAFQDYQLAVGREAR